MKTSVRGKNNILTKKEVRYMLNFFGQILLGKRLSKNLYVEVHFVELPEDTLGLCNPIEDGKRHPREFEIYVDPSLSKKKQITTIAHEMVHIMQFARGEFKILEQRDIYRWMGQKVVYSRKQYRNMPWEVEAHCSEKYLYGFYTKHCRRNKLEFDNAKKGASNRTVSSRLAIQAEGCEVS